MAKHYTDLKKILERAKKLAPIKVAVVGADQGLVLATIKEAKDRNLVEPVLIGDPDRIKKCADAEEIDVDLDAIVATGTNAESARIATKLVHDGEVDAIMKGQIHTDILMRALLDKRLGLRLPDRRASHLFAIDIPTYPKLLAVTDIAINIVPDLKAKAEILQNAIEFWHTLGIVEPKCAILSAIETVNPAIASTLDAACLVVMARRGQITGALIDGPLAFDNAISAKAAREKGIESDVSGDADILLVPDLVSGNILAKNLEYLAGATAAGIVLGLSAPVVLSSRADPPASRLASLALAVLMCEDRAALGERKIEKEIDSVIHCAAQPEAACQPLGH